MKKQLSGVFLFSIMLSAAVFGQYTAQVQNNSSPPAIVGGYAQFSGNIYTTPCQPALPGYKLTFILPPDADLVSVTYTVFDTVTTVFPGTYAVKPVPPIYIMVGDQLIPQWPAGLTIVDGKDMAIYGRNAFFPASHFADLQVGMGRQYKLADLIIYPYLYNPVTGKLNALVEGKAEVHFTVIPGFVLTIGRTPWYEEMFKDQIDNDTSVLQLYELPARIASVVSAVRRNCGIHYELASGGAFRVPPWYAGSMNSITFFDFLGKKIYSVTTKEPVISIKDGKSLPPGKYVARIKPVD